MQATVVMLIALAGLGCQNPASDLPPIPSPTVRAVPAELAPAETAVESAPVPTSEPAPPPYPTYIGASVFDSADPTEYQSFRSGLRDTFCSFFIGRSPDVPSAREIEDAYRAGYYNR